MNTPIRFCNHCQLRQMNLVVSRLSNRFVTKRASAALLFCTIFFLELKNSIAMVSVSLLTSHTFLSQCNRFSLCWLHNCSFVEVYCMCFVIISPAVEKPGKFLGVHRILHNDSQIHKIPRKIHT